MPLVRVSGGPYCRLRPNQDPDPCPRRWLPCPYLPLGRLRRRHRGAAKPARSCGTFLLTEYCVTRSELLLLIVAPNGRPGQGLPALACVPGSSAKRTPRCQRPHRTVIQASVHPAAANAAVLNSHGSALQLAWSLRTARAGSDGTARAGSGEPAGPRGYRPK